MTTPLVTVRCPWGCAIGYIETDIHGRPKWRHHQEDRVIKRDILGTGHKTSFRPWFGGDCRHKPYIFQVPWDEVEAVWETARNSGPLTRYARPLEGEEDVVRSPNAPVLYAKDQLSYVLNRLNS
jgi:hypothetical protein